MNALVRLHVAVFIVIFWASAAVSHAASPSHKKAALDFLDATVFDARMKIPFDAPPTGVPALDQLMQGYLRAPEIQKMKQQIAVILPRVRDGVAEGYADLFTETELKVLTKFFRAGAGSKYATAIPRLHVIEGTLLAKELLNLMPGFTESVNRFGQMQLAKEAERGELIGPAEAGDADAQYRLGQLYCTTQFPNMEINERLAKCLEWKRRAAGGGHRNAQFEIGSSHAYGQHGSEKSGTEAFRWMKLAAEQGHVIAQFNVGSAYAGNTRVFGNQPTGVEVNPQEAEAWIAKSANAGNMIAAMALADMYMDGRVLQRNLPQAVNWYTQAAAKRNLLAARKLGEIYEKGVDGKPDLAEALKWYKQAAGVPVQPVKPAPAQPAQ